MMKQILLVFLMLLPMVASADDSGTCGDNLTWTFVESTGTLTISGSGEMTHYYSSNYIPWANYKENIKTVIVPDDVTSICMWAFSNCTSLNSITIPNSVTSIGGYAFSDCSSLTTITIPDGVTIISENTFSRCTGLSSITIPDNVTNIGQYAFSGCSNLSSINLPSQLSFIGVAAFQGCSSLTSISFPNSLIKIGNFAFSDCNGLTSIIIPESVQSIGGGVFANCANLTSISVESGNRFLNSRNNCNAIIDSDSYTLLMGCKNTVIPNSVTTIGFAAFQGCTGLKSITFHSNLTTIEGSAFYGCTGLTSLTIPSSITSIGLSAFGGCEIKSLETHYETLSYEIISLGSLENLVVGAEVTTISGISECPNLTSIIVESGNPNYDSRNDCNALIETSTNTLLKGCSNSIIPDGVITIGERAFNQCKGLTSINIPNSVTTINLQAFQNCSDVTSITIGKKLSSIHVGAFALCSKLTSITVSSENPNYDSRNNCNAIIQTSSNTLLLGCKNTIIPDNVTVIAPLAFANSGVTSITIPNSVVEILDFAFAYCSALTDVYCYTVVPPTTTNATAFEDTNIGNATLHVPAGSIEAYRTAPWSGFNKIVAAPAQEYTDEEHGVIYTFANGTYTVSGHTEVCTGTLTIPETVNGYSVTSIDNMAFLACRNLSSVTIPNSVTTIGAYAFMECSGLKSLTIGEGVSSIGGRGFYNCHITDIYCYTEDFPSIGYDTFCCLNSYEGGFDEHYDYRGRVTLHVLKNYVDTYRNKYSCFKEIVALPDQECTDNQGVIYTLNSDRQTYTVSGHTDACTGTILATVNGCSVTSIGNDAFAGCNNLWITIPNSVTSIESSAFQDCTCTHIMVTEGNPVYDSRNYCDAIIETASDKLIAGCNKTIIPNSVKTIGGMAFMSRRSLTSITIPNSVTCIEPYAFASCSDLTSVTIRGGLTNIGANAFIGSTNITDVYLFNDDVPTINPDLTYGQDCKYSLFGQPAPINATLHVPAGSLDAYMADDKWRANFKEIVPITDAAVVNGLYFLLNTEDKTAEVGLQESCVDYVEIPQSIKVNNVTYKVTSISDMAFLACRNLSSVIIPNNVTTIGEYAFMECTGLKSLTIGEDVSTIGYRGFYNCYITDIYCYSEDFPYSSYGDTFCCLNFDEDGRFNEHYDYRGRVTLHVLKNYVDTYRNKYSCFKEIVALSDQEYTDAQGVIYTYVAKGTYTVSGYTSACTGGITIPAEINGYSVTSIDKCAFMWCSNLSKVEIPSTITSIGEGAFVFSPTNIISHISEPFAISNNVFGTSDSWPSETTDPSSATLYVPVGTKAKYEALEGWTKFKEIVELGLPEAKSDLAYLGTAQKLISASSIATMQYSLDGTTYSTTIPQGTDAKEYTIYYKEDNLGIANSIKVTIAPKTVSSPTISLSETTCSYDGTAKEPTVTVKDGSSTIPSAEYTVSYTNNTEVGTATVTITDKEGGNYIVSGSTSFTICRAIKDIFKGSDLWAGYVAQEDLAVPTGLTAYVITSLGNSTATASQITYIPQGVPVLLKRDNADANSFEASPGTGTSPTTNLLKAYTTDKTVANREGYVLFKDEFVLVSAGTLPAGKVFLPANSSSKSSTRSIIIDGGDTTDIDGMKVDPDQSDEKWYDLQGRRLDKKPTKKGLYILNGRKVIVK